VLCFIKQASSLVRRKPQTEGQ